jgi:hypothetical protein
MYTGAVVGISNGVGVTTLVLELSA